MRAIVAGRIVVAATVALTAIAFWRPLNDAFALPKATVLVVGALVALAVVAAAGPTRLVDRRFTLLVAAFLALLVLSTVLAEHPLQALVGGRMRLAGAATYLACGLLAVATVQLFDRGSVRWIAWAFLGAGAVVAGYALAQHQGIDPLHVPVATARQVSTMGNVDFVGGWLAIVTPIALWAALSRAHRDGMALLGGGVALASLVATVLGGTSQGLASLVVGAAVVLATWLHEGGWINRRRLAGVALLVVVIGLAGLPQLRRQVDQGLLDRRLFWSVAVIDVGDRPVLGHGADSFADRWFALRAEDPRACRLGSGRNVNAGSAHDVPLDMAVAGGLPLAAAYLLVAGYVGWRLLRGLRAQRGEQRLLLAGLGGAWLAYHLQSLVSIDQPALAVAHWVLAGAVIVAAGRGEPSAPAPRNRAGWVVGGLVAVVALAAVVPATRPLRAELQLASALRADAHGQPDTSVRHLESAIGLAPWAPVYHSFLAVRVTPERALVEAERAARLTPGDPYLANAAAGAARLVGDEAARIRWTAESIRDDPCNPLWRRRS